MDGWMDGYLNEFRYSLIHVNLMTRDVWMFLTGVIERWELLQAQAVSKEQCSTSDPQQLTSDLHDITSWLERVSPELERLQKPEASAIVDMLEARVKELKVSFTPFTHMNYPQNIPFTFTNMTDVILVSQVHIFIFKWQEMQKTFARYKTVMLSLNLGGRELRQGASEGAHELQEGLRSMNRRWTEACDGLEGWEGSLRNTLIRCQVRELWLFLQMYLSLEYQIDLFWSDFIQEFHETMHSLLLWLAHAESRRYTVNMEDPSVQLSALQEHSNTLKVRQTLAYFGTFRYMIRPLWGFKVQY